MRDGFRARSVRSFIGASCALALTAGWLGWTAVPATATAYRNATAITIPVAGQASPYPSTISIPTAGPVVDVNVTLTDISHTFPGDIDVLLVGPAGQSTVLMADTGGNTPISSLDFTFDDAASAALPVGASITGGGTYRPTNGDAFNGTAPAPAGPYGATLSVFNGSDAAGTWTLFVFDDGDGDSGSISGGWSLDITVAEITSFTPDAGKVGDTVTLTGVGFSGATAMKFGSTPVATFTVDSDTQITATVPAGASTGPVSVTTPLGVLTRSSSFVVSHERNVSITLSGKKAKGTVNVRDGFEPCGKNVPVKVQHLKHGKWKAVGGVLTKANGSYKAIHLVGRGKYRTVAKKTTLSSGDVCLKAVSPIAKK